MTALKLASGGGHDMDGDGTVSKGEMFTDLGENAGGGLTNAPTFTIVLMWSLYDATTMPPATSSPDKTTLPPDDGTITAPPSMAQTTTTRTHGTVPTLPPGMTSPPSRLLSASMTTMQRRRMIPTEPRLPEVLTRLSSEEAQCQQ